MTKTKSNNSTGLLAFSVQAPDAGTISFAKDNYTAKKDGANYLGLELSEIVSCRRMPSLDVYADQGSVPWKVLIEEHGWSQECGWCQRLVSKESTVRVYNEDGEHVYCDAECLARRNNHDLDNDAEDKLSAALEQSLIDATLARFEGVMNVVVDDAAKGMVHFSFPGSDGAAWWKVGADTVSLNKVDAAAWNTYRECYRKVPVDPEHTPPEGGGDTQQPGEDESQH